MKKTVCPYCGNKDLKDQEYCDDTCQAKAEAFYARKEKRKKVFSVFSAIGVMAVMAGAMYTALDMRMGFVALGCGMALFGLILMIWGYGTPELYNKYGIRKTGWLVRGAGLLICIAGILLALLWWHYRLT